MSLHNLIIEYLYCIYRFIFEILEINNRKCDNLGHCSISVKADPFQVE